MRSAVGCLDARVAPVRGGRGRGRERAAIELLPGQQQRQHCLLHGVRVLGVAPALLVGQCPGGRARGWPCWWSPRAGCGLTPSSWRSGRHRPRGPERPGRPCPRPSRPCAAASARGLSVRWPGETLKITIVLGAMEESSSQLFKPHFQTGYTFVQIKNEATADARRLDKIGKPWKTFVVAKEPFVRNDRQGKKEGRECYNCHKTGHIAADCKAPKKERPAFTGTCNVCEQVGHKSYECPKRDKKDKKKSTTAAVAQPVKAQQQVQQPAQQQQQQMPLQQGGWSWQPHPSQWSQVPPQQGSQAMVSQTVQQPMMQAPVGQQLYCPPMYQNGQQGQQHMPPPHWQQPGQFQQQPQQLESSVAMAAVEIEEPPVHGQMKIYDSNIGKYKIVQSK